MSISLIHRLAFPGTENYIVDQEILILLQEPEDITPPPSGPFIWKKALRGNLS